MKRLEFYSTSQLGFSHFFYSTRSSSILADVLLLLLQGVQTGLSFYDEASGVLLNSTIQDNEIGICVSSTVQVNTQLDEMR